MQYLRLFLPVVLILALTACGGGGSGDKNGLTGDNSTVGDLSLSSDEFDQYTGKTTSANLSADLMDLYVAIVLSNSNEIPINYSNTVSTPDTSPSTSVEEPSSSSEPAIIGETENCTEGGTRTTKTTVYDELTGVIEIQFNQCREDDITQDGKVIIEVLNGRDSNFEGIVYFKKLRISDSGSHTRISGRQHIKEEEYGKKVDVVSDLVWIDLITEAQIKLEDFKTTSSCTGCNYVSDATYDGRVYHSDYGYLDVSTPEPLNESNSYSDNGFIGQLSFLSSSGQRFLITYDYEEVFKQSTVNHKLYSVRVQLDSDSDGQFEQELVFPFELAFLFEIYDIADSDGDIMTDGWERLFGYSPSDDSDAALDSDSDGYTNLEEFLYGGNPLSDSVVPRVTDLSIELSEYLEDVRGGQSQTIQVVVNNPNTVYGANNVTVIVTKSPNVEWDESYSGGWTKLNNNQVSRTIDFIRQDSGSGYSIKIIGEPGEYSISANVISQTADTNISNNQRSLSSSFDPRISDIGLVAYNSSIQDIYKSYDAAVVGYEHSFRLSLTHWGPDDSLNTVFRMNLPEHVQTLSANFVVDNVSSGDCTVAEEIYCALGTIYSNGASYKGYIQINVKGESEGIAEYTASIISDSNDQSPEDNTLTKEMFVGQSLKPIQDQIDAAVEAIEIDLPAGMYVGGLNFLQKNVTLNGSDGPDKTVIRTVSPVSELEQLFYIGSDTTIRNIYFAGREAVTYSSPAINIRGENILIENNIFEHHGTNAVGIEGWASNVNISGNTFRNSNAGFGSLCHILVLSGPGPYRVENNLIHDTNCTAISMARPFNSPAESAVSTIINNTILNNFAGIADSVMYETSSFQIINNIMAGNQTGIVVRDYRTDFYDDPYTLPDISNNLFFENQEDISVSSNLEVVFSEDGTNIYSDPLFVDEAAHNFELSPESTAVDAGTNNDAPAYDLNGSLRPQDGNGDGVLQVDIGAFESRY